MRYFRPLPSERRLIALARTVRFPARLGEITDTARHMHFSRSIVAFLSLFSESDTFESSVDFVNQCEELKLLINEARHAPREILRSPQG